jgi:anti-sigma factor RsiW
MSGATMDCHEFEQFAEFYLDRELADRESADVETHLAECPKCSSALRSMRETKARLRSAAGGCPVTAEFKARLDASLRQHPIGGTPPRRSLRRAGSMVAASAVLAAGAAVVLQTGGGARVRNLVSTSGQAGVVLPAATTDDPLVSQAADWHRRNVPVEVTGPSGGAVGSWFADKVDFPVRVPEFGDRATLLGGRMTTVGSKPAALLVYDVEGTKLSVLVTDGDQAAAPPEASRHVGGRSIYLDNTSTPFSVAFERRNGLTYSYTSSLGSEDLVQLVSAER